MNPIIAMILRRLGLGLLTLFAVSIIMFAAIEALPGDYAQSILGRSATPETVAAFEHDIGLDRPAVLRYLDWIGGILRGDFGNSFATAGAWGAGHERTVTSMVGPRLANTLFLATMTAAIAVPLSLILGLLAALYRNSLFDRMVNLVALTAISAPEFFTAYVLMLFLAVRYPIFYSLATIAPDASLAERISRCALPVMTLMFVTVAYMMRMTRASIINLLASPYIEMARLKGVRPSRIILRHALPNAWAPIATVVAFTLAYLIAGVVVVEVVFAYPGVGQLLVNSVAVRDIPVVQCCGLAFALAYILLNLLADIVSIVTNPRLLHRR